MSFLSSIGTFLMAEFVDFYDRDICADNRAKRDVAAAFLNNEIQHGSVCTEAFNGTDCYNVTPELVFKLDCAKPIGARLTIKRFESIVPIILGRWNNVEPVFGERESFPEFDLLEEKMCLDHSRSKE